MAGFTESARHHQGTVGVTGERLDVWEGWHQTTQGVCRGSSTQDTLDSVREQLFG